MFYFIEITKIYIAGKYISVKISLNTCYFHISQGHKSWYIPQRGGCRVYCVYNHTEMFLYNLPSSLFICTPFDFKHSIYKTREDGIGVCICAAICEYDVSGRKHQNHYQGTYMYMVRLFSCLYFLLFRWMGGGLSKILYHTGIYLNMLMISLAINII